MFNQILHGLSKFFTREKVVLFIALIILFWGIITYSDSKYMVFDSMDTGSPSHVSQNQHNKEQPQTEQSNQNNVVQPIMGNTYALQPVANPSDLLPHDQNSQWSALNPVSMNQGNVNMPDLLQAGYHIGLDTIGQTLRNANQQLRSDPIIPVQAVGPWNQSTIEPDYGRTPLEINPSNK
jgi:hypothetical protein